LIGAEALIRWRHPVRGLVSPAEFMPVVNASSISERIAGWVLETACKQARIWERAGHRVRVGINLSPSQLQSGDLATSVAAMLDVTGLTPSLLELEVTEDILLLDEQRVLDTFLRIQELGVRVVFDDFGTGYASLSYLKKFPLDGLKIDRSFVPICCDSAMRRCRLDHRPQQATRPVRDRRRRREPRYRRSAGEHGVRRGAGLFLRPADAGPGVRGAIPDGARFYRAGAQRR
jgi:EAL domain-containing protein (putative c-di-GMP-specific phosphodiesterase class I)